MHTRHSGFTLIELSIVLVIIGLIVGGVLAGKDLIRAAKIRSNVVQLQQFQMAIRTFQSKYNCLPGDCTNATALGLGAHNGNGDGVLSNASSNNYAEYIYSWEHLSNAKLIPGTYDGDTSKFTGDYGCPTSTCPAMKIKPTTTYLLGGLWDWVGNIYNTPGQSDSIAVFTQDQAYDEYGYLNVYDVFSIDTKMDDGKADRGKFMTMNDYLATGCVSGDASVTDGSVDYIMTDTADDCHPLFILN